jgi:hypothetical protein
MKSFPYLPPFVDRTGKAKRDTLEYFLFHPGRHTPQERNADPYLGGADEIGEAAIQMRLLRYVGMGLLAREKVSRAWEYALTVRGEDRLLWLWNKFGVEEPPKDMTPEEREVRVQEIRHRIADLEAFLEQG